MAPSSLSAVSISREALLAGLSARIDRLRTPPQLEAVAEPKAAD